MGFSRQEFWSGLPCPPPGGLPNPVTEPTSLMSPALAGGFCANSATWEPLLFHIRQCIHPNATLSICPTLSCLHVHKSVLYVWVSIPALQIGSSAPLFCYHVFFKGEHKRLSWFVLCLSLRETKHTQLAKPDNGRGRRCTESLTPDRHHVNAAHRKGTAQESRAPSSAFTHALPEASEDLNSGLCLATNQLVTQFCYTASSRTSSCICAVVPPYPRGICFKTPGGHLKPWRDQPHLWFFLYVR